MTRNARIWPFSVRGTIVLVPLMAVAMYGGIYGFLWVVREGGEFLLRVMK